MNKYAIGAWVSLNGLILGLVVSPAVRAWGPAGHQTVGAIADGLLAGTNAGKEVKKILGTETLQTAALWADCVKGVTDKKTTLKFVVNPKYSECNSFQSAAGQQAMVEYVQRNLDSCHPAADEETCHRQYHYADVAIERSTYDRADKGTSDHDVVSAINAAVAKLKGDAVPAPFSFKTRKEALRVLAHFVGDVHQPLHVGAIYLDAAGHEVDPDSGPFDPATKTQGANKLMDDCEKLHGQWDDIPTHLTVAHFKIAGIAAAQLVPSTSGPVSGWAQSWASDSVVASHAVFQGLTIGPQKVAKHTWPVSESAGYDTSREALQRDQLVKAGARLAQLLEAVWP